MLNIIYLTCFRPKPYLIVLTDNFAANITKCHKDGSYMNEILLEIVIE